MPSSNPTQHDADTGPLGREADHHAPYPKTRASLPSKPALLVLLLGLILTSIMAVWEQSNLKRQDEQRFEQLSDRISAEVSRRVMVYRYGLMGTRSVFVASENVEREEFIELVNARELEAEFPGALGIGYIESIPQDEDSFNAFLERVRADGVPDFNVTLPPGAAPLPGSVYDDRLIIRNIEPLSVNRSALGLDIGSHPARREAAERALLTGEGCITGKIELVQDSLHVAGFLYLLPHYEPGMPIETEAQRIAAIRGWVYMPMLGPTVFKDIMAVDNDELDIDVFDGEAHNLATLIYDADGHLDEIVAEGQSIDAAYTEQDFHKNELVEIGGRIWTLAISSTDQFQYAPRSTIWMIGVGGAMLSMLLATMVHMMGTATERAQGIAKNMTAELRAYARSAQDATLAKSAFLANMSHEIRTPMTAILGYTELIESQVNDTDQEIAEFTRTIKRNGNHLSALINDILDISKIEAGKMEVERIPTRPVAIIADVFSLMQVSASAKGLNFDAELSTPIPNSVQCDPVRLRQILVNLVSNAIKFTELGGVKIFASYDQRSNEMMVQVVDTGRGMTEQESSTLFGAFEQGDASTTREFGGTGLGLHISQRLARMLDGEISFVSEKDQGSTFTVRVKADTTEGTPIVPAGPIAEAGCDEGGLSEPTLHGQGDNTPNPMPLQGMRILLAEDGPDNQRLIEHHLKKAGAQVKIAANGRLAVQALTHDYTFDGPLADPPPFDLLLTDMQMPEVDGYTATAVLRDKGCILPIIALTAHAMQGDAKKCLAAGCDDYATKPISKAQLIAVCVKATADKPSAAA